MKYTVIKSRDQYLAYCDRLEVLLETESSQTSVLQDEIELLTLLIDHYDRNSEDVFEMDPVELLRELMASHGLKSKDVAEILEVSKGLVSDILNYKKGMSKQVIRTLSNHFKLNQEAFNRPYGLMNQDKRA